MASGTRGAEADQRLMDMERHTNEMLVEIGQRQTIVEINFEELKQAIALLSTQQHKLLAKEEPKPPEAGVGNLELPPDLGRHTRYEFPKFDGAGLEGWLMRADFFFEIGRVPESERVRVAALHLEGRALQWHKGIVTLHGDVAYRSWNCYANGRAARFGTHAYADPLLDLCNLRQTGSLQEYMDEFEELYPCTGIREYQAMSFFLSGLFDELQIPVRMFKPTCLADAYALAKLQELTVRAITGKPKPSYNSSVQPSNFSSSSKSLTLVDESCGKDDCEAEEGLEGEIEAGVDLQLSLNAMWGTQGARIMRIRGRCQGRNLRVLIDTGSTHNFVNSQVAQKLKFSLVNVPMVAVEVANGQMLQCHQEGSGCQRDIAWNFGTLRMSFILDSVVYVLQGEGWGPKASSLTCLKLLSQYIEDEGDTHFTDNIRIGEVMSAVEGQLMRCASLLQVEPWPELLHLLSYFADIFEELKGLPPRRSHDHRIVLKAGSEPINIRPYKYAAQQKDAIESMLKEMLEAGVIQHSRSSYASPIVLVKKKDGSWQMCVDYRSLNANTVKDKYPIPVIEELLDELGGAGWFSKIDHRSGYWQV
ncbi:uncharacterized protein LOC121796622 [Salvia splendens]|uniref:uncharacterized protein LOC121796622 n=1 Tax=Salvia splendens TaxID=180675 RepID=UPI001C2560AB|nr:uncharacterized protein LOC121796622 [Salvia splendens]